MMCNVGLSCLNYLDGFAGVENELTATFAFNFYVNFLLEVELRRLLIKLVLLLRL
jgi:hypothetical protein